jgi:hypothetical protein
MDYTTRISAQFLTALYEGGLLSLLLYKENNKLQD